MINFGIIGTNWISDQLVEAAHESKIWKLTSVYSRRLAKAKEFGSKYEASHFFDDLAEFFESSAFDVVYIASPNSLHFEQTMLALKNGKSVIVEKPALVSNKEYQAVNDFLKSHPKQYVIEAARHIHTDLFKKASIEVKKLSKITGASLVTRQYSSRIQPILNHEKNLPNVFNPNFAGGALMDIGVYAVYVAVALFGVSKKAMYYPNKYDNGIDLSGNAVLTYDDFNVSLNIAKDSNSLAPSEIYGLKDQVYFDSLLAMKQGHYLDSDGQKHDIEAKQFDNPMTEEMLEFGQMFEGDKQAMFEKYWQLSMNVGKVMNELRKSCNLVFPADKR